MNILFSWCFNKFGSIINVEFSNFETITMKNYVHHNHIALQVKLQNNLYTTTLQLSYVNIRN
jgi:hypothetical protein